MNKTGFGFLRLPKADLSDDNSVDFEHSCVLVDRFIALGGNYFDTAYTYLGGNSERAVRECVIGRYPRAQVRIADKLPSWLLKSHADCPRIFSEQLERCGVDYFDVYLLHGLDRENYAICEQTNAFGFIQRLKEEGRVLRTGFSFHDSPELLDEILTAHPELDYVQLQINYLDWESPSIQARRCWELAVKHNKPIIVMEPVKGGSLAQPPAEAELALRTLDPNASMASWAIRFAQDLGNVEVVLSGMNTVEQIDDNLCKRPALSNDELAALSKSAEIIRSNIAVACTGCSYCVDGCPQAIPIPHLFALYNEYMRSPKELWKMEYRYRELTSGRGRAVDCISCGACEGSCPQKLDVINKIGKVREVFEGKENA